MMKPSNLIAALTLYTTSALSAVPPTPPCAPYELCYIKQVAPNTEWRVKQERYGYHLYWWLQDEVGRIKTYGMACAYAGGECGPLQFGLWMKEFLASKDQRTTFKTGWETHVKSYDCNKAEDYNRTDWIGDICREHNWVYRNSKALWEAGIKPVVWKVKPNGTATTRPSYTLINNVRGTKDMGRAPIGSVCNVDKPYQLSGTDVWAAFDATGNVTLCNR